LIFVAACAQGASDGAPMPFGGVGSTGEAMPMGSDDEGGEVGAPVGDESGVGGGCNVGERGCTCAPHDKCKLGLECVDGLCDACEGCGWCGDGSCDAPETCNDCPADCNACQSCGDGTCDASENCTTCPDECGVCESCGNDTCDVEEDCFSCEADCGACDVPEDDPCENAYAGAGSYCGEGIVGDVGVLYTCSAAGTTTSTQSCANGCASCPANVEDTCRGAGETVDEACGVYECDYDDDPDGCDANGQWCWGGSCQSCSVGFLNCDHTAGCECNGYCSNTIAGKCCTEALGCTAGCPLC
jgi:hypothetical protein